MPNAVMPNPNAVLTCMHGGEISHPHIRGSHHSIRARLIRLLLRIGQLLRPNRQHPVANGPGQGSDLFQAGLEFLQLALLDHQGLVVQILDDEVVLVLVDLQDDGFDGRIAFDQHALHSCQYRSSLHVVARRDVQKRLPLTAFGMALGTRTWAGVEINSKDRLGVLALLPLAPAAWVVSASFVRASVSYQMR